MANKKLGLKILILSNVFVFGMVVTGCELFEETPIVLTVANEMSADLVIEHIQVFIPFEREWRRVGGGSFNIASGERGSIELRLNRNNFTEGRQRITISLQLNRAVSGNHGEPMTRNIGFETFIRGSETFIITGEATRIRREN